MLPALLTPLPRCSLRPRSHPGPIPAWSGSTCLAPAPRPDQHEPGSGWGGTTESAARQLDSDRESPAAPEPSSPRKPSHGGLCASCGVLPGLRGFSLMSSSRGRVRLQFLRHSACSVVLRGFESSRLWCVNIFLGFIYLRWRKERERERESIRAQREREQQDSGRMT